MSELQETSVLIVEPDIDLQRTYRQHLIHDPNIRLLGICSSARSAVAILERVRCDILFTEIDLIEESGLEFLEHVSKNNLAGASVVLTSNLSSTVVVDCFEAGALGYVLKNEQIANNPRFLIRTILSGGSPISPIPAKYLVESFRSRKPNSENPITRVNLSQEKNPLSPREREILQLLSKGMRFSEISEVLNISNHTVTAHIKKIYKKLQVHSRGEAVYEAALMGIL